VAVLRDRPYGQFNFLVSIEGIDPKSVQGGFMEVSGLGTEIEVIEYRAGNSELNAPIKLTGLYRVPDVSLKRGLIGSLDLYEWLREVRNGSQNALRAVVIQLLSEDRSTVVQEWRLINARPVVYRGPALDALAEDVAVEELVLASEDIELA
jgi:phage tail-like protein